MAFINAQDLTESGIAFTFNTSAVAGDAVQNNGLTIVKVINSSGANTYTVTPALQQSATDKPGWGPLAKAAPAGVTVGVSQEWIWGGFYTTPFNNAVGAVEFSYSGSAVATDLKIGCARIADGRVN